MKKTLLIGLVPIALLALSFGLVMRVSDADKNSQKATTATAQKNVAADDPEIWNLPPPKAGERINKQMRARLLAAIAKGVAQSQQQQAQADAGPQDSGPLTSQSPKKTFIRKVMRYQRDARRQLGPIVRDCINKHRLDTPGAIGPQNQVKMTLEGSEKIGAVVTQVQLNGANAPLDAPALQNCLQQKAFSLRLPAPPIRPGETERKSYVSFPLFVPQGTQDLSPQGQPQVPAAQN